MAADSLAVGSAYLLDKTANHFGQYESLRTVRSKKIKFACMFVRFINPMRHDPLAPTAAQFRPRVLILYQEWSGARYLKSLLRVDECDLAHAARRDEARYTVEDFKPDVILAEVDAVDRKAIRSLAI